MPVEFQVSAGVPPSFLVLAGVKVGFELLGESKQASEYSKQYSASQNGQVHWGSWYFLFMHMISSSSPLSPSATPSSSSFCLWIDFCVSSIFLCQDSTWSLRGFTDFFVNAFWFFSTLILCTSLGNVEGVSLLIFLESFYAFWLGLPDISARLSRKYRWEQPRICTSEFLLNLSIEPWFPSTLMRKLIYFAPFVDMLQSFWNACGCTVMWMHAPIRTKSWKIPLMISLSSADNPAWSCSLLILFSSPFSRSRSVDCSHIHTKTNAHQDFSMRLRHFLRLPLPLSRWRTHSRVEPHRFKLPAVTQDENHPSHQAKIFNRDREMLSCLDLFF